MNADVTLIVDNSSYRTHTKRFELPAGTYKACAQIKGHPERCRMIHLRSGTDNEVTIPLD